MLRQHASDLFFTLFIVASVLYNRQDEFHCIRIPRNHRLNTSQLLIRDRFARFVVRNKDLRLSFFLFRKTRMVSQYLAHQLNSALPFTASDQGYSLASNEVAEKRDNRYSVRKGSVDGRYQGGGIGRKKNDPVNF